MFSPWIVGVAFGAALWTPKPSIQVGSFNIENFPKSQIQVEGAFKTIRSLNLSAVGVQEIINPQRFLSEAQARLGPSWRFVYGTAKDRRDRLKIGVLYNSDKLSFRSVRIHQLGVGRPAVEVRLARPSGRVLRMLVVHLKAGGDSAEIRRRQLAAFGPILAEAMRSEEQVVALGDFNSTGPEDRRRLEALARETNMVWASKGLACTSYWARRDGCLASALDHVFTWRAPSAVAARGPCETDGCHRRDRCPIFHREVSDHCPVTVQLP